jgi:diguanylate cyclase (GGDEF)-like protein/PAS domain S-box-containing protein
MISSDSADIRSKDRREHGMQIDYRSLLAKIRDGVYFTDTDRRITYWNKAAERISGYGADEVVGRCCRDNILVHVDEAGRSMCHGHCPLAATILDATPREAKVFLHHKQGHRVPVYVRSAPLSDLDGRIVGAAEFFTDISSEETLQTRIQELENLALLDNLTLLPNRHHIEPELVSRFHEIKRLNVPFGFIFMDIDHFKRFNDSYGHDVGDEVLRVVARTLKASVRPFDLVGRWGGEEFVCVARNVAPLILLTIANRIRMLIGTSTIPVGNEMLGVTVSMGATMAMTEDNIETLIKRADELMYTSKNNGRNQVTLG